MALIISNYSVISFSRFKADKKSALKNINSGIDQF